MQEKSIASFCNVYVILHVLQSSSHTIFFLTFVSNFIFSNLILAYWDILQDSTTHRNFLLRKLFVYNATILGIKAAWKIKFCFLISRTFRLSRLFTYYCGRLKLRLTYSTLIFPTLLNYIILFYIFKTTLFVRFLLFQILQFFGIQFTFFYFTYFFFPFKFLPRW